MTLGHPAHSVSLEPFEAALQGLKSTVGANCRGIVTSDVLEQGLSRGAIAARKLKGVKRDKGHEDYTGSAPYGEGKSVRPVEVVLLKVSMTRELNRYAWLSICCLSP